jgi:hypothetical protein
MPSSLVGSLDDRLCGDLAGDRGEQLGVPDGDACPLLFPTAPPEAGIAPRPSRRPPRIRPRPHNRRGRRKPAEARPSTAHLRAAQDSRRPQRQRRAAPSGAKCRPLALVDAREDGGDELDRVALAMNSSTSNIRYRTEPYGPRLRRRATVPRSIGGLITSRLSRIRRACGPTGWLKACHRVRCSRLH